MSRNDKRTRLVQAADELFHQQGVSTTTLANIAALAEVPLGNVYYYFKSKDSIILAVIEYRRQLMNRQFEGLTQYTDAKARLTALIQEAAEAGEKTAEFGDALGSLCQELGKQGGSIAQSAAQLMHDFMAWFETQFKTLGKDVENAKQLASTLVIGLQGMKLLTLTLKDPTLSQQHSRTLIRWLEAV